jgi:hypothetical protein
MRGRAFVLVLIAVMGLGAIACSDDAGGSPSAPDSVQAAVDAIEDGDADALASQARFTAIGCTTADGLGGPPKCEPGQPEGTEVEVLPAAACEGYYIKAGEEAGSFAGFIDGDIVLDSAFRTNGNDLFPVGYILLMTYSGSQFPEHARALFLDEDGVTGLFTGCMHTLDQLRSGWTVGEAVWMP